MAQVQHQQKFFLEDLPDEILLRIYSNARYHKVTSAKRHSVYEEALIEHLINIAPVITANIQDLSFANLRPFLSLLKERNQLTFFERPLPNLPAPPRQIRMRHIITKKFPKDADKLIAFASFVDNKLYKAPSLSLYTDSSVAQGDGCEATEAFFRATQHIIGQGIRSDVRIDVMTAIEEYVLGEHVAILARQRAENEANEQLGAELFGPGEYVGE